MNSVNAFSVLAAALPSLAETLISDPGSGQATSHGQVRDTWGFLPLEAASADWRRQRGTHGDADKGVEAARRARSGLRCSPPQSARFASRVHSDVELIPPTPPRRALLFSELQLCLGFVSLQYR